MKHFGYWVFGKDMTNVKPKTLKDNGITDLFLNYYAFTSHGKTKVLAFIKECKTYKIDVHIWVQCFYDGEWHNPKTTDLTAKLKEIKKYAAMENVKGVHLDYLRYPGNAYKTDGGVDAITAFVKKVRSQNPDTFLSCAIMPESENKKYYGQDISALGKICDAVLPMQYKGNYGQGTSWLTSTTKQFSKDATIWSGLQTYKSDDDTTQLTSKELLNDTKTCINAGAKGAVLFRYGICPTVNFTTLQDKTTTTTTTAKKTYSYKEIIKQARLLKKNVEKTQKMGMNSRWAYYFAKAIKKPNTSIQKLSFEEAKNPTGDYISRDVQKADYLDMAKRLITYVEKNKKMPNYVTYKGIKVLPRLVIYAFAKILVYYEDHNKTAPKYVTISSKAYTKPTETGNVVYDYWVKKFGFKPTCIDDVCDYIRDHFEYEFYFDDYKSNQQVIDSKAGNCVDLTQMAVNMAKALGYEWEVIHTECRQSGTGHVYPRFRKGGEWFTRDVACIADESTYCVWCDVEDGRGYLLAKNPSWLLENLNR